MAVNPPNPVNIPYDGTITMLSTDKLQLKFTEAGRFCSADYDDFTPNLPNDTVFAANDVWPDPNTYPDGASPAGDGDSTYRYHTNTNKKCGDDEDPTDTPQRTISVGSGNL